MCLAQPSQRGAIKSIFNRIMGAMKHKVSKLKKELIITPVRVDGLTFALSADGELPKRIKVLKWGENPNWYGLNIRVGKELVAAMNSTVYPWKKVALDYEHNTLPGTRAYRESSEPRTVAGFGPVEVVEGEGVFLCMENYTPSGVENALNYCDVSAAPSLDRNGNVTSIKSVALCRNGAVPEMDFCEVALSIDADVFDVITGNKNKENPMKEKWRAFLAKLLKKSPEEVTEEEVDSAVKMAGGKEPEEKPAEPAPVALSADAFGAAVTAAVQKAVKPLEEKVVGMSADLDKFKGVGLASRKQGIMDEARRAGKAVNLPEAAVVALSVEQLEEHVKGLSVTIPVDQRTPKHVAEPGANGEIGEDQRTVALNCGMEPEKVFGKESIMSKGFLRMKGVFALFAAVILVAAIAFALPYNSPEKLGTYCRLTAGEEIHSGWLVCVWTNGLAYAADDTANYTVVGQAQASVASGSSIDVAGGIYRYDNEGSFADKDVGSYAYMWTNTTHYSLGTAAVGSNDVKAGTIVDVDSDGVWIDTRRQ